MNYKVKKVEVSWLGKINVHSISTSITLLIYQIHRPVNVATHELINRPVTDSLAHCLKDN